MATCVSWGRPEASRVIGLCADCLQRLPREEIPLDIHRKARRHLSRVHIRNLHPL